jgi:hypothetical protein
MIKKYKYPKTKHLHWSNSIANDDKILKSIDHFIGKEIIMTEKMDGENTTCAKEYIHARSLDSVDHPSRHWLKGFWSTFNYEIPEGWRICGENLYAEHSIHYNSLESYFEVFSIWDENNKCLSWDDTVEWCKLLGLSHVPVIWRGIFDEQFLRNYTFDTEKQEGYVIRLASDFDFKDFSKSVAKFVRPGHVTTDDHWMNKKIVPNELNKINNMRNDKSTF